VIRLGVLGWPVAHSRSPTLQNAGLHAVGLGDSWHYQLLPVPPELFAETVRALPAAGFRGANVTIPHKQAALALATDASERARAIGAANTLLFEQDGRLWADNTDAPALIEALVQHVQVAGATALVLGAGGSARAAVWALGDAGAGRVLMWNRTPQRAAQLASELGAQAVTDPAKVVNADILVNCTAVGLSQEDQLGELLPSTHQLRHYRAIADFVYREGGTPLTRAARANNIPTVDGLELLLGQGAIAFELFTGKAAPIEAMRDSLRLSSGS
jgi:shikimate dehydrogenase